MKRTLSSVCKKKKIILMIANSHNSRYNGEETATSYISVPDGVFSFFSFQELPSEDPR